MARRAFGFGNTAISSTSSPVLVTRAITAGISIIITTLTSIPASSATCRRIHRSQLPLKRNVSQEDVQRTQILPQPLRPIPLLLAPITPARRPARPARTLRRSALRRSPQDEIDPLVETRGGFAGSAKELGGVAGGGGRGVTKRRHYRVGGEGAGLEEGAGEDGAEGELVGGAVLAGRAGDFGQGAVFGFGVAGEGAGEGGVYGEEGGDVALV